MSIPQCFKCCARSGSVTISSSAYEKTSAPSAVIVPSFTQRGYFVSLKCSSAWPFPPEPSQFFLPQSKVPSLKLSHKFVHKSQREHFHFLGSGEILTPLSSWTKSRAYFDSFGASGCQAAISAFISADVESRMNLDTFWINGIG